MGTGLASLLALLGRGVLSEADAKELFAAMRETLGVDAIVVGQEWGRFGGFLRSEGVPPEWPKVYAELGHQDPARAYLAARPLGSWFFVRADSTPAELEMELHQEFLRLGFRDAAIGRLPSPGSPINLVLYRMNSRSDDFGDDDRTLLSMLSPHLQQAFGRARSARAWRGEADAVRRDVLLSLPHARLATHEGVIEWSRAAEQLFEKQFSQPFAKQRARLDAMIRHLCASDAGQSWPIVGDLYGEVLVIRGDKGVEELVVIFESADVASTDDAAQSPAEELLSPKQRLVARLAAQGLPLREVAARLELSVETARTHLKTVYQRLGVSERSSLAHLLRR